MLGQSQKEMQTLKRLNHKRVRINKKKKQTFHMKVQDQMSSLENSTACHTGP
jgi:hypothetical protein